MRRLFAQPMIALVLCLPATVLPAQDRQPPRGPGDRVSQGRPEGFGPPVLALLDALDTNHDGKLSVEEIQAAPESLKKLDKNGDGRLSGEEIGWPPRRPDFPRGGPPFGQRGGRSLAERIMARDADKNGKVTAEELPRSMHFLLRLGDTDQDGALDKSEAERLSKQLGENG